MKYDWRNPCQEPRQHQKARESLRDPAAHVKMGLCKRVTQHHPVLVGAEREAPRAPQRVRFFSLVLIANKFIKDIFGSASAFITVYIVSLYKLRKSLKS